MKHHHTKEQIEIAVAASKSWGEVCRRIGIKPFTGSQSFLRNKAKKMGIDCSHFSGQRWNTGIKTGRKPIDAYVRHGAGINSAKLRQRLIEEGIKQAECETCKRREWMGRPIPLELDHLNSDHFDNRLDNLSIVCPNCHALATADRIATKKAHRFGQYVMF